MPTRRSNRPADRKSGRPRADDPPSPTPPRDGEAGELSISDTVKLLAAVQALSSVHDVESAGEIVRHWARELSQADGVTFILRDGDHCYYADENAIAPLWKGRRFLAKTCISGWAMEHHQAVVISDIFADPRIPVDAYRPTFVKSLAVVPVRQEDPIAAIGAYWASHHTATPREVSLLQALANATSVALSNAELFVAVEGERDRFRQLTEALPQIVWTAPADGHARYLNRRWSEFTGLTVDQGLGRGWLEAVHADDRAELLARFEGATRALTSFEAECRMRRADGAHHWMLIRAVPIQRDGQVREWVGTCTDIHAQKESEHAKAEGIWIRDEFLSIVSHELKTPLTALRLQLQSALERGAAGQPLGPYLERANRQVGRLSSLVEQLLDGWEFTTGRIELAPEEFDLRELLTEIAERFAHAAQAAGCEVRLELPDRPVRGCWDRTRLDRALTNLLSNALKYGAGAPVLARVEPSDEAVRVRVVDHGIGISPEDQERIFARFERAVPVRHYGGLGLGLYVAHQIALSHGGRLSVQSQTGAGATFTVDLPRSIPGRTDCAALVP